MTSDLPLSYETVRTQLERAVTKRQFEAVVQYFRRQGVVEGEVRQRLEREAEELAQKFVSEEERSRGVRYLPGRVKHGFHSVLRGR